MEIGTIFPVTSLSATNFSTVCENRRQQNNSAQPDGDTVSLSPKALERARQSRLAAFCGTYGTDKLGETEGDAAGADEAITAEDRYRKQFNAYRGMGLFTAPEQTGETSSGQASAAGGSGERSSDDSSNQTAKLERQIRDLTKELEEVMAADLPDVQKEASAQELQKKISERQSQLTALKRGERMADAAVRG